MYASTSFVVYRWRGSQFPPLVLLPAHSVLVHVLLHVHDAQQVLLLLLRLADVHFANLCDQRYACLPLTAPVFGPVSHFLALPASLLRRFSLLQVDQQVF